MAAVSVISKQSLPASRSPAALTSPASASPSSPIRKSKNPSSPSDTAERLIAQSRRKSRNGGGWLRRVRIALRITQRSIARIRP